MKSHRLTLPPAEGTARCVTGTVEHGSQQAANDTPTGEVMLLDPSSVRNRFLFR
jgi:hypothetical protein